MNSSVYTVPIPTFCRETRASSAYYRAVDVSGYLNKLELLAYESENDGDGFADFRRVFLGYRAEPVYEQILCDSTHGSRLLQRYILDVLATIDYIDIKNSEEQYTLRQLETNDLMLQEAALGAIIDWGTIKKPEQLKVVTIRNYYLQKDLNEFVGGLENT